MFGCFNCRHRNDAVKFGVADRIESSEMAIRQGALILVQQEKHRAKTNSSTHDALKSRTVDPGLIFGLPSQLF